MAPSAIRILEPISTLALDDVSAIKSLLVDGESRTGHGGHHLPPLVLQMMKNRIEKVDHNVCDAGEEDAFFVADLGQVYRQHLRWKTHLKRVKPFYAVKCNPDYQVLRLLAELGTGFDCASKQEIQQVLQLGVDPSRIIYANPCKMGSYIRHAAGNHVRQMTFDNADELYKVKQHFPDAELYLRILTDDSSSLCRLSLKFGAPLDTTRELLLLARDLGLNVVGVSFHVGSGATDPQLFVKAIEDARLVFDQAEEVGFNLKTLDIGGGFTHHQFEVMAAVISTALDHLFPPHVRVIGEPGRYYVASAFTLACHVIARRTLEDAISRQRSYMIYLNDGVYGNFSSIMFDHQTPVAKILRCGQVYEGGGGGGGGCCEECCLHRHDASMTQYSIWGPTCDGIDCISARCVLPGVLDVGDWLYFEDMGAYTMCSATRFNGFTNTHDVLYVVSEPGAAALLNVD
ncbi:MAG: Ornithine decarboxylase [Phylliscum demangeonii]|nr:MAG: Ornithine decarboxylase [Phylliscum demangeonii]